MLKLEKNIVPTWLIDGANKVYVLPFVISSIDDITVDWIVTTEFTTENATITLTSAPITTITVSYFKREERENTWNWQVTLGTLVEDIYEEIWRRQYSTLYPDSRLKKEANKSIWALDDEMNEHSRLQQYAFKGSNWLVVSDVITNEVTLAESYNLDISWLFLVWDNIKYDYYAFDWEKFTVYNWGLIEYRDELLVGHRIPYWVEKVSEVYIDSVKLEYVDQANFYINSFGVYSIIKDFQWNSYLMLPYNKEEYTCVVKFVPDRDILTDDEDVIDVPYKYTRAITYDVSYRILASREDERWQYYEVQSKSEKKKYINYKNKTTKKVRGKIWFASAYEGRKPNEYNPIPSDVYDAYLN